jgi:hypothetical protein
LFSSCWKQRNQRAAYDNVWLIYSAIWQPWFRLTVNAIKQIDEFGWVKFTLPERAESWLWSLIFVIEILGFEPSILFQVTHLRNHTVLYNIAFVNSERWLAKSRVDITQCQHGKFSAACKHGNFSYPSGFWHCYIIKNI